ncbi:hypothetical protein GETHLI_14680 [Geothrix limicola]|uniref:Uncharacterized protein n=1 Tax=Geothrix limicola TaxID=2927978 RepID=A0ABQ5QEW8_9BACT|nr:hypothetical protein [Geothrix limicola]GLH72966.1 hypothetical protein GETHLI_14680 [Geothrix limicola]
MRPCPALLTALLSATLLVAQEAAPLPSLELRTHLGGDSATDIRLAPKGCWDGLILGVLAQTPGSATPRLRRGQATVEVWDLMPATTPRHEAFALYLGELRASLSRAWLVPPPKHQALELNEIMANDPSSPQKLDLTKVKSMQERFNRLPPSGSTVK